MPTFAVTLLAGCGELTRRIEEAENSSSFTQIAMQTASPGECPAGGSALVVFQDTNLNTLLDAGESIKARSVICNGADGASGANGQNGANGNDGQNGSNGQDGADGQNGQDGQNATYLMGAVGSLTRTEGISACHHDYLYLPSSDDRSPGWLLFRHQRNGSADQGIGTTGFQVWNVDISEFNLASEVGGVVYCRLSWDDRARVLYYQVVSDVDGLAGEEGKIGF